MLMKKVSKLAIIIQKNFYKKYGEQNTLIVSADIENQINQLINDEKKSYMEMIGLKRNRFGFINSKRI